MIWYVHLLAIEVSVVLGGRRSQGVDALLVMTIAHSQVVLKPVVQHKRSVVISYVVARAKY
jgi:hypothetical protein